MLKGFQEKSKAPPAPLETRPMIQFLKAKNQENLIGAEIGVFHGINAFSILSTLSIKKLFLVDPYILYDEYTDIRAPVFSSIKKDAEQRLAPFQDKISWIAKKSADAVNDLPGELDFVYIDGNHSFKYVLEDIEKYFPKVKKGGIIGGHDFVFPQTQNLNRFPWWHDVRNAVEKFCTEKNLTFKGDPPDWWIVV